MSQDLASDPPSWVAERSTKRGDRQRRIDHIQSAEDALGSLRRLIREIVPWVYGRQSNTGTVLGITHIVEHWSEPIGELLDLLPEGSEIRSELRHGFTLRAPEAVSRMMDKATRIADDPQLIAAWQQAEPGSIPVASGSLAELHTALSSSNSAGWTTLPGFVEPDPRPQPEGVVKLEPRRLPEGLVKVVHRFYDEQAHITSPFPGEPLTRQVNVSFHRPVTHVPGPDDERDADYYTMWRAAEAAMTGESLALSRIGLVSCRALQLTPQPPTARSKSRVLPWCPR